MGRKLLHVTGDVAVITCVECGRECGDNAGGWQGHLADLDDDGDDEVVLFCPDWLSFENNAIDGFFLPGFLSVTYL